MAVSCLIVPLRAGKETSRLLSHQDVCAGAVPVLCLENRTFAYQAFSEYWILVKITFTTG